MKKHLFFPTLSLLSLLLASCATYEMPANHSGPTASITSTSKPINAFKAEGYYILSVNGKSANHSPMNTPRGGGMLVQQEERTLKVPCEPLVLKISGGNIYAADGVALADSMIGANHYVSGEIAFTPKPNGQYAVAGATGKSYTAVWIVDQKTSKIVSSKVEKK